MPTMTKFLANTLEMCINEFKHIYLMFILIMCCLRAFINSPYKVVMKSFSLLIKIKIITTTNINLPLLNQTHSE